MGAVMWDRPDLLNRTANFLYGLGALLAFIAAAAFVIQLPIFPLREIRLDASPVHVTRGEIEHGLRDVIRGNFFTLDLEAIRDAFGRLPWVRGVELRRRWPDSLEVTLEEHVPLARWAGKALVNTHGELFRAAFDDPLPLFLGPEGAAKEMAIQYEYFRRGLSSIGRQPVQVHVSPRRAWQLTLENGLVLELGREQIEARLARFIGVYERTVATLDQEVRHVDLRYANGFAVRMPRMPGPERKRGQDKS